MSHHVLWVYYTHIDTNEDINFDVHDALVNHKKKDIVVIANAVIIWVGIDRVRVDVVIVCSMMTN